MVRPAIVVLFALGLGSPLKGQAPLPPLSAAELFHVPTIGEARVSGDGQHLAALVADSHDQFNLITYDLKDFQAKGGVRASDTMEVSYFRWSGDNSILFSVLRRKTYSVGLYTARLPAFGHVLTLDRSDVVMIVGFPRSRPGHAIVWITKSAHNLSRPDDELLELDLGRAVDETRPAGIVRESVVAGYQPPKAGAVVGWECDRQGELALCTTWQDGAYHTFRFLAASKGWAELALPANVHPMALDYDSRYLWVVRYAANLGYELCRVSLETGTAEAAVCRDPVYDLGAGHLYFSDAAKQLAGVGYLRQAPASVWFNPVFAAAQAVLNRRRPDTHNVLADYDQAERRFLFRVMGPAHPDTYELLDLDAKTLRHVSDDSPLVGDGRLVPARPFSFVTRDGVTLEGYQTLPTGASPSHPVPLVVLVHGGPWVRDSGEFDPVVQFLANRGYAVLQPNYRGSSGYNPAISHDGQYDFRRMERDVADATKAMLASGAISPGRIAIMGGSFGGYLAISGVAFEDRLYCCAISECGVFDWREHIKSKRDVARPGEYQILKDELGQPNRENERLDEISPLDHVDNIHVPVLLAHGLDDTVVDVGQSKKLANELKRRGVPCETFFRPWVGHGFFGYADRVDFYQRVEAFLAANLGGAMPPAVH